MALTVGAGRLAALTFPSGVDELVIDGVTADVDIVPAARRGRDAAFGSPGDEMVGDSSGRESVNDSGDDGKPDEGEGRGDSP